MPPILIATLVAAPILALGTSLYVHRRGLSSRVRVVLMAVLFLFILAAGPVIAWLGCMEKSRETWLTTAALG